MLGLALIEAALCDDDVEKIYAVVRPGSVKTRRICQSDRVEIVSCDILRYDRLPDLIPEKIDVFYHFAWKRTSTYQESTDDIVAKIYHLGGVVRAIEAAHRMGSAKFIGAGTQAEYGVTDQILTPSSPCQPVRSDGILKLAAGQLAMAVSEKFGMDCIWVRVFSVYGKDDRHDSMVMTTVRKLSAGEECRFTACEQMWDYLHERDAGAAFWMVGKNVHKSCFYCLASGITRPLREYIEIIRDIVAPKAQLGIGALPYPEKPVMQLKADISDLERDTGWHPQVSFSEGIREIVQG